MRANKNYMIIPSASVDIRRLYKSYKKQWLFELDLFTESFFKPIVAITGTVGKTTITKLLADILQQYRQKFCVGGNIGTGTLDLIQNQDSVDFALLETADIQLKYATHFAPDLAVWTNFSPNHLDWHDTIEDYFKAKCNILMHQKPHQKALVPVEIIPKLRSLTNLKNRSLYVFSCKPLARAETTLMQPDDILFVIEHNAIVKYANQNRTHLIDLTQLPEITFTQNWLIICCVLDMLGLPLEKLVRSTQNLTLPAHRFEKVATVNQIDFYKDSKRATPASTLAAVQKLHNKPIILFLGGLSKGIDRTKLIKDLKNHVKIIYCFGSEAQELYNACTMHTIPAYCSDTLDKAFHACIDNLQPGDQVLFSPAGSSFDLFKNYQDRGNYFKKLVDQLKIEE